MLRRMWYIVKQGRSRAPVKHSSINQKFGFQSLAAYFYSDMWENVNGLINEFIAKDVGERLPCIQSAPVLGIDQSLVLRL